MNVNEICNDKCPFVKFDDQISNLAISTNYLPQENNCFETTGAFNKFYRNHSVETELSSTFFTGHCGQYEKTCIPAKNTKISFYQCYNNIR